MELDRRGDGGLTTIEHAIFTALARYRFLTAPQLLRIGVSSSRRYLYKSLHHLAARRPHILRSIAFGVHAERGHLPALYYLTPSGSQLLAEADREEPMPVPERVHRFANDYFHRVHTIDCHIAICQWATSAGNSLEFFHTYFDHSADRKPRTHVKLPKGSIVPDAVFRLVDPGSQARLFALEMYNRRETYRVEQQIARYLLALKREVIEEAYRHHSALRVLCVFDEAPALDLILKRVARRPDFPSVAPQFFFKTLSDLSADFYGGWRVGDAMGGLTGLWTTPAQKLSSDAVAAR
jgi:hypothetical protein